MSYELLWASSFYELLRLSWRLHQFFKFSFWALLFYISTFLMQWKFTYSSILTLPSLCTKSCCFILGCAFIYCHDLGQILGLWARILACSISTENCLSFQMLNFCKKNPKVATLCIFAMKAFCREWDFQTDAEKLHFWICHFFILCKIAAGCQVHKSSWDAIVAVPYWDVLLPDCYQKISKIVHRENYNWSFIGNSR